MRLLYAIDKAGADPVEYVKGMLAHGRRYRALGIGSTRPRTHGPHTCAA